MMKRFGLYKYLPVGRLRNTQPLTRWIPNRLVERIPPMRVGRVKTDVSIGEMTGEVWVSPKDYLECQCLPKGLKSLEVVGVDGFRAFPDQNRMHPVFTDGNAIEFSIYLERFLLNIQGNAPISRIKIAIGGNDPLQVSTVARLLGREVGEMVLIGDRPYLRRLAGQILAETGLAVRISPKLPEEPFEKVVWCGERNLWGKSCDLLFSYNGESAGVYFPWTLQSSSDSVIRETKSFAAMEAILMLVGGWDTSVAMPGRLSVEWVNHIGKLMRDVGFRLPLEELDTPSPVGYNVDNL